MKYNLVYHKWFYHSAEGEDGEFYAESIDSPEIDGDLILRHVVRIENNFYWSTRDSWKDERFMYMEHPFLTCWKGSIDFQEISKEEFDRAWNVSIKI